MQEDTPIGRHFDELMTQFVGKVSFVVLATQRAWAEVTYRQTDRLL